MPESGSILIRCDGDDRIGLGHVGRCLALAEAWRRAGIATRFIGRFGAAAQRMLARADMLAQPAGGALGTPEDRALLSGQASGARAVLVDSYAMDLDYLRSLRALFPALLVIDDFAALPGYPCDAVLNFTAAATSLHYPTVARCALGPGYLPARGALRGRRGRARSGATVRHILVAIGGGGDSAHAHAVAASLSQLAPGVEVRVVLGSAPEAAVAARFDGLARLDVGLPDLAEALDWADLCICGGGLTKYEAVYVGVPAAVLSVNTEQWADTQLLASAGLCVDLGMVQDLADEAFALKLAECIDDADARGRMVARGLDAIPADAPDRAAALLLGTAR